MLKSFLLLLDVTFVIFARVTNADVWQAIVKRALGKTVVSHPPCNYVYFGFTMFNIKPLYLRKNKPIMSTESQHKQTASRFQFLATQDTDHTINKERDL